MLGGGRILIGQPAPSTMASSASRAPLVFCSFPRFGLSLGPSDQGSDQGVIR